MAKRALSWKRAGVIGWRDLKSAPGKFGFVVLSVAVGVAALVGVRGFSESFRKTLSKEARSLMAGDLSARILHEPTAEEKGKIAAIEQARAGGIRSTWVTETISMASVPSDPVPVLVSLKAVDPAEYPYYGEARLEPGRRGDSLQQALDGDSAVVAEEFLIRLNAQVGQTMRLGGRNFTIAAVLRQEPDRISAGAGLGPRVMISQAALERTGLLAPGSRATHRLLMKLPEKLPAGVSSRADAAAVRKQLEAALPDAQVMDFREGNPALTQGLDNSTAILSLICLVAMVLGAIGVAMAMHAHLEQRMDMLAILKALGAGSGDLLRIFLLQTLGLGLAGGVLGVAAWVGVMAALPAVFGKLLPVQAARISLEVDCGRVGNGAADDAAVLFASAAGRAGGQAGAGAAQAGGTGAGGHRRMVCALVGAPSATGDFGGRGAGAGWDCLGAVGLGQGGHMVCRAVCHCAGGPAGAGVGCVANAALPAQSCAAAAAFVLAARAGQSL